MYSVYLEDSSCSYEFITHFKYYDEALDFAFGLVLQRDRNAMIVDDISGKKHLIRADITL